MPISRLSILLTCIAVAAHITAVRADDSPRVRFTDPVVGDALSRGVSRSKTFRDLLTRLAASDLVVYVERAAPSRSRTSGHIQFVGATPLYRYARITLYADRSTDAIVALLGHELQHAVEIADAPSVVDERTYGELYRSIGKASCGAPRWCFDTKAAMKAGYRVLRELRPDDRLVSAGLALADE